MSILSTNKKLIRIGDDYSAGSGIDITDRVISVTSFGPEYSAGPNIDIQDYVISGRDWSEEINAVSANANSAFNEWVSNDYTTDQTNITNKFTFVSGEIDNKLDKSESAKYYPMEGNPSGFLIQHQDLTYLSGKVDEKLDTTAFSSVSGDFLTSIPDEYATKDFVSNSITGKLDISSFSSVSGDFVTNDYIQNNYYTKTDTSSKEELTNAFNNVNVPSSVLDLSGFEYNEQNLISGYGGSAFAGQGGAEYTGIAPIVVDNENDTIGLDTFILSGGQNVDLVEDYENNIVRIDIDLSGMSFDDYYKKTETSSKEEITNALGGLSNVYYPLTGNPSGFLTQHQSLTNYYTKNETSSRDELNTAIQYVSANAGKTYTGVLPIVVNNTTNEISADAWVLSGGTGISLVDDNINNITRIDVTAQGGDPEVQGLVRSNSSTWDSVTNKLDTTAFSTVSGTFLTAVDLSPYATETLVEETSGAITSLIPTDYYPDTNPSGFISGVDLSDYATTADLALKQDTLTFDYDEQDRISAINNSAIAAGDEFPVSADEAIQYVQTNSANIDDTVTSYQTNSSTYMVEPNLEYNAVNEISGYNGSAIAQYGAEKQWLQHDDTLVHAANSAQYALGVNLSAVAQLLGVDETVLFESTSGGVLSGSFTENLTNFNYIEFFCNRVNTTANSNLAGSLKIAMVGEGVPSEIMLQAGLHTDPSAMFAPREFFDLTNSGFAWQAGYNPTINRIGTSGTNIITLNFKNFGITKVIGIGRKEV